MKFRREHCEMALHHSSLSLNLIENGLCLQVIVFRLLYCFFLPRTSEHGITSLLSWLPLLYIVNAKTPRLPAQIGQVYIVPMA